LLLLGNHGLDTMFWNLFDRGGIGNWPCCPFVHF